MEDGCECMSLIVDQVGRRREQHRDVFFDDEKSDCSDENAEIEGLNAKLAKVSKRACGLRGSSGKEADKEDAGGGCDCDSQR